MINQIFTYIPSYLFLKMKQQTHDKLNVWRTRKKSEPQMGYEPTMIVGSYPIWGSDFFRVLQAFIFILLSLFLSTSLSFKLLLFLFFSFNTAYFIYRSLALALFSGREITGTDSRSL